MISHASAKRVKSIGIAFIVMAQIVRLSPQRPVVSSQIQDVKHPFLENIDSSIISREILGIDLVLAVITILHDDGQPGRAVREFFDLNRLFNDDAV